MRLRDALTGEREDAGRGSQHDPLLAFPAHRFYGDCGPGDFPGFFATPGGNPATGDPLDDARTPVPNAYLEAMMFQIVEISTMSGSQYTVITDSEKVLLNVARPSDHYLPEHEVFVLTDWSLRATQGVLRGVFTTAMGDLTTSAVLSVRQQIVAQEVYV